MRNFFREFKDFATKGNVVDLAVGIMIGAAFNNVVNALVKDIMTPPINLLLHRVDFSNLTVNVHGTPIFLIGDFLNNVISFLITAFTIFLLVKYINRLRRRRDDKNKGPAPAPTTKKCPQCFTDIPIQAHRCPNCTSELDAAPAR